MTKATQLPKVGLIGLGNMGRHHARLLAASKHCEFTCVCDLSLEKAQECASTYRVPAVTQNPSEVFRQVDMVFIAASTHTHLPLIQEALDNSCGVFVEKPLCEDLAGAHNLIDAAVKNAFVSVGFIERFNPVVRFLKRSLDSRAFGTITHLHCQRYAPRPPQILDTNILQDTTVHDFDLVAFLLGEKPKLVAAQLNNYLGAAIDDATLMLKHHNTNILIQSHWLAQERFRKLSLITTQARFDLDLVSREALVCLSDAALAPSSWEKQQDLYKGVAYKVPIDEEEPLKHEIEETLLAFTHQQKPPVTMQEAAYPLEVIEEALKLNVNANNEAMR